MSFTISKDIVLTQDKTNSTIESFITQFLLRKIAEQSPTGQEEGWSNTPPTTVAADQEVWVRTKITYKKGNITWSEYNPEISGYKDATWENIVKSQTDIENIQKQVDKSIDVWYDYGEPVVKDENENIISFYRQWEENEDSYHIGDIYYDLNTTNSYRFIKDEANNYNWSKVQDTQTSALVTQIKDLKDNKVSIYSSENYPEKAQINDLFFPSTGNGVSYKCIGSYDNTIDANKRPEKWEYIQGSGIVLIQYKAVARNLNNSSLEQELSDNAGWLEEMPIFNNETEIYQRTAIKWENAYIHIGEAINISAGQKTIDKIINYYLITSSSDKPEKPITETNSPWVSDDKETFSLPNPNAEKPYLWNYEKIVYSNNATATTPVTLIGNYSLEGKAIDQVLEYYKTTSTTTLSDPPETFDDLQKDKTWVTEIEALSDSNPYLWNIEVIKYSKEVSGKSEKQIDYKLTKPIMIGYKGRDGNHYITISCNPDISSGRITIQENQEIILTATYHVGERLAEESKVKYSWYNNKSSSLSPISTNKSCEITLAVDSEENSYTCKCQYDNGDEISETICFSKIPKTLGYQLQSTNPANRFLSVNPETKEKSIAVRPTKLQLTLHEVINEQQIESSALSIWAKRPKGGYQEAKFEENYFIFDLSKWYVENFVVDNQHQDVFSENIDFYLDNEGQTYIGSIPFADATPDEILKLVETAYSMNWLIDNNAMVFDTNGLHLYNGNFEICKTGTDSNGNVTTESVLYFDSKKAQLVVKGHIEAETGEIGGWDINTNHIASQITGTYKRFVLNSASNTGSSKWIKAYDENDKETFYLSKNGELSATKGKIGGCTIDEAGIYSGSESNTAGIGLYNKRYAFWAGGTLNDAANGTAKFVVDHGGSLVATGAEIEGSVIAQNNVTSLGALGYSSAEEWYNDTKQPNEPTFENLVDWTRDQVVIDFVNSGFSETKNYLNKATQTIVAKNGQTFANLTPFGLILERGELTSFYGNNNIIFQLDDEKCEISFNKKYFSFYQDGLVSILSFVCEGVEITSNSPNTDLPLKSEFHCSSDQIVISQSVEIDGQTMTSGITTAPLLGIPTVALGSTITNPKESLDYRSEIFCLGGTISFGAYYNNKSGTMTFGYDIDKDAVILSLPNAIYFQAPIYGLNRAQLIPEGANLNDYKTPGVYGIPGHARAQTLYNTPWGENPVSNASAGKLIVYSSMGDGGLGEPWSYITQEYIPLDADKPNYKRLLSTGSQANVWIYGSWYAK